MFEPHYQPDPRIPGMGLAFFRGNAGGHSVVEHQGIVPGFNSQIVLAPGDGVGVLAFTNGARQAVLWLSAETAGLLHHLLGVPDEAIRSDVPHHPELWGDLCGWYYLPGRLSDARVRGTGRRRRGLHQPWAAHVPDPDTRDVPGLGAAPRRPTTRMCSGSTSDRPPPAWSSA